MKLHVRLIAVSLCGVSALIFSTGCEDSSARERQQVQQTLSQVGGELQMALASAGSGDEQSAAKLNGIVAKLGSVSGGDPGQQAAKSLMSATALRELANMQLANADAIETDLAHRRAVLRSQIDGILTLNALAAGVGAAGDQKHDGSLAADLDASQKRASEIAAALAKLQSEIKDRDEPNTAASEQVAKLREQVAQLRSKAQEMGSADGFETFRHAAETSRQADKIENEIGHRQAELEYALRPEEKLTGSQSEQVKAMIKSLQETQAKLSAISAALKGDVATTASKSDEMLKGVTADLAKLDDEVTTSLAPAYDKALSALDNAGKQAGNAARGTSGDDAQAAKLVGARICETQGRAHAQQARGLADQIALLKSLALVEGDGGAAAIKTATAAHEEAIAQAKAAYEAAQSLASGVQLRNNPAASEAFSKSLDAAIASLSGKPAEAAPTVAPAAAPAAGGLTMPTASTGEVPPGGFASPDEAIAFLGMVATSDDSVEVQQNKVLDSTYASSAAGRAKIEMTRSILSNMAGLYAAMNEKYGKEQAGAAMKAANLSATPDMTNVKVKPIDDTHASYDVSAGGMTVTEQLIKVGDKWYFDADHINPQEQQMMAMKDLILPATKKAMDETAAAVKEGKYATPAEAMQGMQKSIMQAVAAAMGGGGMSGAPGK